MIETLPFSFESRVEAAAARVAEEAIAEGWHSGTTSQKEAFTGIKELHSTAVEKAKRHQPK